MSKIVKKMKIMQPGGTLSDYVLIGAEAENINVDGESVETKLDKKPYYYDTVTDMKADTKLKAGDMAVTLGYYSVNDGGGAEYKVVSSSNNYYEDLNNNLKAELIINSNLCPEQVGYTDDIGDIINTLINKGIKTIHLNDKVYTCKTTINLLDERGITIYGNSNRTSIIVGQTGNTPIINMVGSVNIKLIDFTITSLSSYDPSNPSPSTIGVVIARTQNHLSSQDHTFRRFDIKLSYGDLTINNGYGSIAFYNFAGESFIVDQCWFDSDLPIYLTNNDDLGIGALYGGYALSNRTTTDITFTNDCYILSKNNLAIKMETCNSINITNCYFNNSNGGNVFEINSVSDVSYEFNNLFINNIRVEGVVENLIHILSNTKLRNANITGGSNTITNNEILMEPSSRLIKSFFNFQSNAEYCAKRNGDTSTYAFIDYSLIYTTKKLDVYAFDNSILIGTSYNYRKNINSFKSLGIGNDGEAIFKNNKSIIFSYTIPTETTNHGSGDICFCTNYASNILLWQFDGYNTQWVPVYKNTTPPANT